jgi:alkanesulfonate monooxygenase SsuD/methylene tetrahydromethanopterin reductase-like flavin-dependent oxidoreductase (luciferase family)
MEYGVHLPLIGFDDRPYSLDHLLTYTGTAEALGYTTLCANDHLVFSRPWLDGPTAMAAVLDRSGQMKLATTLTLPVVRGPVATAKTLAAIDILSGGRLIVGVGPGSSARDYDSVGLQFEERWKRLDESVLALRALWQQGAPAFEGSYYSTEGIGLEPYAAQRPGPPIWIGSWGSAAGLRRTARLGDGWLASAYNTTPELFGDAWTRLGGYLRDAGKSSERFPNALATMFFYVTEDRSEAERGLTQVVSPAINRPAEELAERLPIGPAEECAAKLAAYQSAGVQSVYVWPVGDDLRQIEAFRDGVVPLVSAPGA